jgi:hypothetical protein
MWCAQTKLSLVTVADIFFCFQANSAGAVGCFTDWGPDCGGMNMKLLWDIVFMGIAIFLVVLIPFAIFYYEADDGEGYVSIFIFYAD